MKKALFLSLTLLVLAVPESLAIMERGDYPWKTKLRSWYDKDMKGCLKGFAEVPWLLNLGPTGIRARIYKAKANQLVVKYVFQDAKSPAKGKVNIEDVIAGANGKLFRTKHRFGRNLKGGGGWDGPMMELAKHIEDSQGSESGILKLIVWPRGNQASQKVVSIQLRRVGRFARTFPYSCRRSAKMAEELCDFLVMDYKSANWKTAGSFYGGVHGRAHQLLALMACGKSKYDPIIKKEMASYYGKKYNPAGGGFQTWGWGFDGIVMGEYYLLTGDERLKPAMKSLVEAMPLGCMHRNGVYTHRSELNLRITARKPYASIAAISGLQMIAMSLFKEARLPYDKGLYRRIHQNYLNSTTPDCVNIAYCFGNANRFNPAAIHPRHAVVKLKDPKKGKSGKGPGYTCPTGMKNIGAYEVKWPTKKDPRWKPLDWLEKERNTNIVTELKPGIYNWGDGLRRIDRRNPNYREAREPAGPYTTKKSGGHLAPVGMGALAHLIGNRDDQKWQWLGYHAANTCALGPGNAFDGHAASNLHGFWSVLGAARSNNAQVRRAYFDYIKTFLILSETHDGGLILQPWGRDRPGCNSDCAYGPRILPTATGVMLLSLGRKRLQITGAKPPTKR